MKKQLVAFAAAALIGGIAAPAFAHHSVPQYFDLSQNVTLTGTIKEFKFQNPHSIMTIEIPAAGGTQEWKAEASLAAWLIRNGWKPDMFKAGTKVTISGSPARDPNAKMIRLLTVTMPDGRKLNANSGSPTS